MKPKTKSNFISAPSWALSISAAIIIFILMGIINSQVVFLDDNPRYIIWAALIAVACFFLAWNDPRSVWYAPLLCNMFIPLVATFDNSFWTTPFGIIIFIGLCLSFVTSILGAKVGRRKTSRFTISKESNMD